MPFATLDTRTRQWKLPDGRTVLISDTVGFLQRLPHHLVASFHATLEEALSVDLLLHVVDASHPDAEVHVRAVGQVLAGLTERVAEILVFNKVDLVLDPIRLQLLVEDPQAEVIHVSAVKGQGIDRLTQAVVRRLDQRSAVVELRLPIGDGKSAAAARAAGVVLKEQADEERLTLTLKVTEGALGNLRRVVGAGAEFEVLESAAEPYLRMEESA